MQITNPVLRGSNPDPSILRVDDDYYIATSTFEWFPGVQIHHSRDLVNWRLLTRPLTRVSQLDIKGVKDSGGVWAPCLSHHDGTYYLVYTVALCQSGMHGGPMNDLYNLVVTAPDIEGPWSEPVHLVNAGFDPSLFHDDDGRKWLLWAAFDHRHGGYYHLMTAEGGTGRNHAVTMARSLAIDGPYEVYPHMGNYSLAFTGAFVGMCCQDLSGHRLPADFDDFEYSEHE